MPSKKRFFEFDTIHHIYNRGVLKMNIFHSDDDFKRFVGRIIKYKKRYPVDVLSFCLIPNHFHFLLREIGTEKPFIPLFMQQLQSSYAKYLEAKYNHSGKVFQGTYKSRFIQNEAHYNVVMHYIRENPVKHGLVDNGDNWKFKYQKTPLRWFLGLTLK